jgi:diguanylate cyclase (GGDEF)-like protein
VLPSLQQAYQMAQAQLALRRQLAPDLAATPTPMVRPYSMEQIAVGLDGLQRELLEEAEPGLLGADEIRHRLSTTLARQGFGEGAVGEASSDAIEVIVSLFEALLGDALVPDFAKTELKRLQPSVHRAALVEEEFFASTQHPLRQVMNRLSMLRQEPGPEGQDVAERVRGLVDEVSRGYDGSPGAVRPALTALDDILREQQRRYTGSVEQVVAGCIEQQAVLRQRREKSGPRPGESTATQQPPAEWNRWLKRARNLRVGERLLLSANGRESAPVALAWIGEDSSAYVFVDPRGAKASTLTLQQVAMNLRRGLLKALPDDGAAAVDRALFGVVNRYHEEVAEQAHHDTLTGLLSRKAFLQSLEERPPPADAAAEAPGALCMLAIDNLKAINERHGLRAGDAVLRRVAEALRNRYGRKSVAIGRLGGGEIGLYWAHSGLQAAYRDVQELCATLNLIESVQEDDALPLRCCAGVIAVEGDAGKPAELVNAVGEACLTARGQAERPVHIAGADHAQRRQVAQLTAYIAKAYERGRLALLCQEVRPLGGQGTPAAYIVVSAEDRNGRLVPPALFGQAVVTAECADDIDLWALRQTLAWMSRNEEAVARFSAFILPLSRAALANDALAGTITAELMQIAVPPSKVCFEIADRDAVAMLAETADLVNTLREFGCQFILGNFGAARTNYEYLKELAVDYVCIQQEFVDEARQNQKDFAMAKSMNELIHFMGKATIARQAEEPVAVDFARTLGIDFIHDQSRATRLVL